MFASFTQFIVTDIDDFFLSAMLYKYFDILS